MRLKPWLVVLWLVVLLSGCLLLFSCTHSAKPPVKLTSLETQIAAYEAEIRTAIIEEKKIPILLGIRPEAQLPSVLQNLAPETEEGLVYWEWIEFPEVGTRIVKETAYGKLSPQGVEFPFAQSFDPLKIYTGVAIRMTFLYKKSTGAWIQRLVLPGMLARKTPRQTQEKLKLTQMGAVPYADEHIQLIDVELIPAEQRAAAIANTFEMIILP
ncbi:MAG: hypothetical protein FWG75_00860 [Cystobacterineae bacterium]|nr:hypothetical protein [Cystobacterineae bacterium]